MKNRFVVLIFIVAIFSIFTACKSERDKPLYAISKNIKADSAAVVSAHPLATQVGIDILRQGGNAVDATIAVQFALAVVYPRAGNIGGGGFMVLRNQDGTTAALDYREKAPLAAHRDMYLDSLGNIVEGLSQKGHLAVGVPGTVAGMVAAHERFGQLKDFPKLVEPALLLAQNGFRITKREAERLNEYREEFLKYNNPDIAFVKQAPWKEGDLLIQSDLANTLGHIYKNGKDGFYKGVVAAKIVAEMQANNGIIDYADLERYEAKWRTPIIEEYKNYKLISMPPPSSGGIALAQLLKIVEKYPLSEYGFHSTKAIHLMAEAERRVYADRAEHLGDSDFYDVPFDSLLDDTYLTQRMADYNSNTATVSDSILAGDFDLVPESFETTHTSVVDSEGNAVSVTTTLNLNYGSKVVVDGAGFFLNDEMDDFSAKPGVPNFFGLVGAEANAIEPEKRMLSSMTPSIFEKDDKLFMVVGAPGGSTIITSVFQTFVNVAEFDMNLNDAVQAGRFHHQWLPDMIMVEEDAVRPEVRTDLHAIGHQLKDRKYLAIIKAIQVLPDGKLQAVGDKRNPDDHAQGF